MDRTCEYCREEPGNSRCSGCSNAWYCSKRCQTDAWTRHKLDCNSGKVTTADRLVVACYDNLIPEDPQTLIDYGFQRAFSHENQGKLLGLYTGLVKVLEVRASTLHRWRKQGTLIEEIKKQFEGIPAPRRGGYYSWFLANQWVLDGKKPAEWGEAKAIEKLAEDMLKAGWKYTGGSPHTTVTEIKQIIPGWGEEKQQCFQFCSLLQSGVHPGPDTSLWIPFGFCTCDGIEDEIELARYYILLLKSCIFKELVEAFSTSRLYQLFLSKGLQSVKASHPLLEGVLAMSPTGSLSVWNLKQYIFCEHNPNFLTPAQSVTVDYGFMNCRDKADFENLKKAYKRFFERTHRKEVELHYACIGGTLHEFVGNFIRMDDKNDLKHLMKNFYPLVDFESSAMDGSDNPSSSTADSNQLALSQDGSDHPLILSSDGAY